jgi:hypothetical protein
MSKTAVAGASKAPRVLRVNWTNDDDWDDSPRLFKAWVSETALKSWLDGLRVTEAWDIQVDNA